MKESGSHQAGTRGRLKGQRSYPLPTACTSTGVPAPGWNIRRDRLPTARVEARFLGGAGGPPTGLAPRSSTRPKQRAPRAWPNVEGAQSQGHPRADGPADPTAGRWKAPLRAAGRRAQGRSARSCKAVRPNPHRGDGRGETGPRSSGGEADGSAGQRDLLAKSTSARRAIRGHARQTATNGKLGGTPGRPSSSTGRSSRGPRGLTGPTRFEGRQARWALSVMGTVKATCVPWRRGQQ